MDLAGSRALITGATGGIGMAIARRLHERGATVVLSGRQADVLERLRAELAERAEVLVCDLADRDQVAALPRRAGKVDVLVANAALPASGHLLDFEPGQIDRALDVNLRAPVMLARELAPSMSERGYGHVVLVSSLSGKAGSAGSSLYSATKFGLRGFGQGLAEDLRVAGVGVTTVFPGFIRDAGMFHESGAKLPRYVGTSTPDKVAKAVVKGIESGKLEIDVAPLGLRVGTALASVAPATVGAIQRRFGAHEIAAEIARGQVTKR
ncbi:MAG TPA: SDR family NAD(P)-dependent oxidoreductase [Thermoleophilaceae bacterium]|nr:SDR family NAD(P)-dependent oxidoreductase [Thermoleophilaceae bacterium]